MSQYRRKCIKRRRSSTHTGRTAVLRWIMTIAKGLQLTSVPLGAATGYFGLQRCCLVIYIITELVQKQQPWKAYGVLYQTWGLHISECAHLLTGSFLCFCFFHHLIQPASSQEGWIMWRNLLLSDSVGGDTSNDFPAHMIVFIRGWDAVIHTHMSHLSLWWHFGAK